MIKKVKSLYVQGKINLLFCIINLIIMFFSDNGLLFFLSTVGFIVNYLAFSVAQGYLDKKVLCGG